MSNILLIEDNADMRIVTRLVLERAGHQVQEAVDPAEAQTMLRESSEPTPDVIIADMRMPVMSGLEFARRLDAEASLSHIPVVLLTGDVEAKNYAPDSVHVVIKPFEPDDLVALVEDLTH